MVNITHKSNTLRKAVAVANVMVSLQETIRAINEKRVPKGDVFSFAKVAALFAVKKTDTVIPDCHPLPVEFTDVRFSVHDLCITLEVEVHTIYKTGVEVEAMHGAAVAALTLYDMLKPIDPHIEIQQIKLLSKSGGKSDRKNTEAINAAVVVCSDSISQQKATDKAGLAVVDKLKQWQINTLHYTIIPDEVTTIQNTIHEFVNKNIQLLIFVGGTGVSKRDVTPDVVKPLLEVELPGIMEQARSYGQERMPYAMLSRSVAGFIQNTLVLTFPGSTGGATEYMDALFPAVLHALSIRNNEPH
ncbi:bifunctional molybdenum cofactor biosynthesis protein MoaC/MoaB [Hydrotalea sandarakina]|jgi:molybdenum cofactor biosynthesis protein MoaC|uniref:Molybdenum cofactor biosynthesis protein MoaC n=1 Tax=Hydrotalea sandarakina TaxID=1004304 RepID=A0A2W7RNM0_9BACT|nr:bifunctional molybdenum cofactor biosynthesis protein MoaC/MoaB [Hydrotalea sandarakina]PZX60070.1 molybdenum cofactor biosynthesis protein MoaC [Hydrotalea sandarakina]